MRDLMDWRVAALNWVYLTYLGSPSLREGPVFSAQVSSFTCQFFSAGKTRNLSQKNRMLSQARDPPIPCK